MSSTTQTNVGAGERTGILGNFKTLSALMPISRMQDEAWEETCDLTERHDVPHEKWVPIDLRDRKGRYYRTREGYRISGRLLVQDMLEGSPSSSVALVFGCYPLIALVLALGTTLGLFGSLFDGLINVLWVIIALTFTGFGPLGLYFIGLLIIVGMSTGLGAISSMFGLIPGIGPLLEEATQGGQANSIVAFIGSLIPGFLPLIPATIQSRSRARALAAQGSICNIESLGSYSFSHIAARQSQAEQAAKDSTKFITLGVATGACTYKWDDYAPDRGLPVGLSESDLSTHLIVFGRTGSGKTSRALKPLARQYAEGSENGLLVFDGKGALPMDLLDAGIPGFQVLAPSPDCLVSLTEGLDPATLAEALSSVADQGGGDESAFFINSGHKLLFSAATLLYAAVKAEKSQVAAGKATTRQYFWSLSQLAQLLNNLAANAEYADGMIKYIRGTDEKRGEFGALADSLAYWKSGGQYFGMDERTRSNVLATVNAWLAPIFTSDDLRPWADAESGVRVEDALYGARFGLNVPYTKFGRAGASVTALIKGRVFLGIRLRGNYGDHWPEKLPGQKPLMIMVDECQEIVSKETEGTLLPIARSLGARCVYATQSVDNVVDRLGEHAAYALLGNFVSFMTFEASLKTYEWVMTQLGHTQHLRFTTNGVGIDYKFTSDMATLSPMRDPKHPDRRLFRNLMRDLRAASVKSVGDAIFSRRMGRKRAFGGATSATDDQSVFLTATEVSPVTAAQYIVEPVASLGDLSTNLSTPGTAFLQVQRAGVKRRDFVSAYRVDQWKELGL
jgi:hypothetical protein